MRRLLALAFAISMFAASARAQEGLPGTADELEAFGAARSERWVRARELATRVVRRRPESFIGHLVLGLAYHQGEASFPRALRETQQALALFTRAHGDPPSPGAPWRWHAILLQELASTYGDLERHEERLATIEKYNALYVPKMLAERAWSLMKLRRFEEARLAAREALATNEPWQVEMALNALCAVEFEAGEYGRSYAACRDALEYGRSSPGGPAAVDLTNFAEAARTELHLAESIDLLVEATGRLDGGYGNPWLELSELMIRGGRFSDAYQALRKVPEVRASRIPSMRDSDRNESMRALASFYLVAGDSKDALRIGDRAIVMPDRRGHNSRDPDQDRAIVALLDRAARRMHAGTTLEEHAGGSFFESLRARFRSVVLRLEAWQSGRRVVERLRDRDKLVGIFQIGLSGAGITPPWLVSDLADVLGPGVARAAIAEARRRDRRPLARGYYDAFEAEALLEAGSYDRAAGLAARAVRTLPEEERLLRARAELVRGRAFLETGRNAQARAAYESAIALDPSIARRLDVPLPARIRASGGLAGEVRDRLASSGRFEDGSIFALDVVGRGNSITVCLRGPTRGFGCAETRRRASESQDDFVRRAVVAFYDRCLSPDLGLGPTDIAALEGPTRTPRNALDHVIEQNPVDQPLAP